MQKPLEVVKTIAYVANSLSPYLQVWNQRRHAAVLSKRHELAQKQDKASTQALY
ncbi:MAG: hypothetical protein RMK91_12210 [Pseudanabaenaceae cyanobacterium SKYGB_i_bin29]|nr:hypothetical protein [Pseudanabaenaceae cyanobacterium SKYG29]MDW8422618.1 hypothetical protein [Pseudanabaenaceae cyanobacterium SKYGB_i_bin29]